MSPDLTFGAASSTPGAEQASGPSSSPEADGSLLSRLRVAAAAQQLEHTEEFAVGGEFKKQLWIRHKPLDGPPMDRFISQRAQMREAAATGAGVPITELNLDLMAQSCVAVLGADEAGENREVLEDERGPILLEHRLAVLLGFPVPPTGALTARDVIMMLFGNNAMAVVNYGDTLVDWMQDPAVEVDPGES
jgi:hypothetical protein